MKGVHLRLDLITLQEKKVATFLIYGWGNKEIAKILGISTHTVKLHVTKLIRKIGAKNRTHAAYNIGTLNNQEDIIFQSMKIY